MQTTPLHNAHPTPAFTFNLLKIGSISEEEVVPVLIKTGLIMYSTSPIIRLSASAHHLLVFAIAKINMVCVCVFLVLYSKFPQFNAAR